MIEVLNMQGRVKPGDLFLMAISMFEESRFSKLSADKMKLWNHVESILADAHFLALGALDEGVLCGMCIGVCGQILPFTRDRVATQHYLYLLPEYRGGDTAPCLIQAFISEAKSRGAKDIVFSNGYGGGPDKVGKLFERCGLTLIGGVYTLGG